MEYQGLLVQQLEGAPAMVMFAAPATDIAQWAGIPQRRRLGVGAEATETAGFQREEKESRVADLADFMRDPRNLIQNPLLAAVQDLTRVSVNPMTGACTVTIEPLDYSALTLSQLFGLALQGLQMRRQDLAQRPANQEIVNRLRAALALTGELTHDLPENYADEEPDAAAGTEEDVYEGASLSLFDEESQVLDFYDELNARQLVLLELGSQADGLDSIGGFDRELLESLVKPVVLVDGQHRLKGALQAIRDYEESDEGMEFSARLIDEGLSPAAASLNLGRAVGRTLPVSLLLSDDPAERVFQFVVVNQKATPMSNALLGTIVSTSLMQAELDPIRLRLSNAGIALEGSRAIASLSRSVESPFRGLVATGMSGDQARALPWSVLGKLIDVVRNLEGGSPYHPPLVDYAKLWREGAFQTSAIIDTELPPSDRLEVWSSLNGPWKTFFLRLHTKIRDQFGDVNDPNAHNYWGSVQSNLFNMVSLQILTADFFAFLHQNGTALGNWEALDNALEAWIGGLSPNYFARDWRMSGTKRDQPIIKKAWSETWAEYRITRDRLPRVERYNPGGRSG